ncbi:uncharacterized protein LOC131667412 [Phymastichus coffea]|uniref:uncharacterized protein LOC131667412 n=1 Tax=Phymastichus coffea TaxID=108790 RepID=UPI00273CE510|nr:uncharacterized protein LOC131667412 [Phymastichus coffea]
MAEYSDTGLMPPGIDGDDISQQMPHGSAASSPPAPPPSPPSAPLPSPPLPSPPPPPSQVPAYGYWGTDNSAGPSAYPQVPYGPPPHQSPARWPHQRHQQHYASRQESMVPYSEVQKLKYKLAAERRKVRNLQDENKSLTAQLELLKKMMP